jgi:thiamine-monophosphate kinase
MSDPAADDLSSLGEFGLIERLASSAPAGETVLVGIGDDTAVVETGGEPILLTTDALVEGRHFLPAADPGDVGWKSIIASVSDIAAMGGVPTVALVTFVIPRELPIERIDRLWSGMVEAAEAYGVAVAGGDTASGDRLMVSVALAGTAAGGRFVRREGAHPGDAICVTGTLGDSALGLELLLAGGPAGIEGAETLVRAHARPEARVAAGRAAAEAGASAMIDVSDGLAADLGHVLDASGVGARIDTTAIPLSAEARAVAEAMRLDALALAVGGGEDFELVITVGRGRMDALVSAVEATGTPLTVIGEVTSGPGSVDETGAEFGRAGYDHFQGG